MTAGGAAFAEQRARLVTELRQGGIADQRVLAAIEQTPREAFVPAELRDEAYLNAPLPIGRGQTISQPYVVALMTQALQVPAQGRVLEIGTGSGYQAAILSRIAGRVFSIERHRALLEEAERRFAELGLCNIACRLGDGAEGWPEQAPFDRIILTAAPPELPPLLIEQLAPDGVLVAPVGDEHGEQHLVRLRRGPDGVSTEDLAPVRFVPLIKGLPPDRELQM